MPIKIEDNGTIIITNPHPMLDDNETLVGLGIDFDSNDNIYIAGRLEYTFT
jgi:hypothetical protein